MLTSEQFNNCWPDIRVGLRNLWGDLTDYEIEAVKDNLFEITDLVQLRYGESKEEINSKIHSLIDSFDNDTDKKIQPDVSSFQRSPL